MGYTIRDAVPSDIARIEELFVEMLRAVYQKDDAAGCGQDAWGRFFQGTGGRICVAEAGGRVQGFLSMEEHREWAPYIYLDDFSVSAPCRGLGMGTALLGAAGQYAKGKGIPLLALHVEGSNLRARRFYQRMGFAAVREEGTRILMIKTVGPVQGGAAPLEYRLGTEGELEAVWDWNVAQNPGDPRWARWKEEYMGYNREGQGLTFLVLDKGEPVGEGTLLLSPGCRPVAGRPGLCDGRRTANVNALRIRKAYEGRGHISRLMGELERYARGRGVTRLTIGVDAKEARNLAIYLHWGYQELLFSQWDEGELVLYYAKDLGGEGHAHG